MGKRVGFFRKLKTKGLNFKEGVSDNQENSFYIDIYNLLMEKQENELYIYIEREKILKKTLNLNFYLIYK